MAGSVEGAVFFLLRLVFGTAVRLGWSSVLLPGAVWLGGGVCANAEQLRSSIRTVLFISKPRGAI